MKQTLVVLAAGLSTRYGGNKQLAPVGPNREALLDYAVYDAVRAGFRCVTFVIRRAVEGCFRDHVAARFGQRVLVEFAYQELDDLPPGTELPDNRVKPWGTAHAILATRELVTSPFVVINADDFYGASAYVLLHEFLDTPRSSGAPEFAMIGYRLYDTYSPFGGVSRGICESSEDRYLERLIEVKKIEKRDSGAAGTTVLGDPLALRGDETVSMNIWALRPAVFPMLQQQFSEFFSENRDNVDAEFLISTALNEQVASGRARLKILDARDKWFGMTFQADKAEVQRRILALVELGVYPEDLTLWFQENA